VYDTFEDALLNAGKLLLSPTRTYLPLMIRLLPIFKDKIHGIIHCSGGGQKKVMHYLQSPLHIIKDNLFPVPHVFRMIQQQSNTDWQEMYQVFNMGHRLEIYTDKETANALITEANNFNIEAQIIGRVEKSLTPRLTLQTPYGTFDYIK
jgi:phosphoribosylformylglycinamidine cyclo-ligase